MPEVMKPEVMKAEAIDPGFLQGFPPCPSYATVWLLAVLRENISGKLTCSFDIFQNCCQLFIRGDLANLAIFCFPDDDITGFESACSLTPRPAAG